LYPFGNKDGSISSSCILYPFGNKDEGISSSCILYPFGNKDEGISSSCILYPFGNRDADISSSCILNPFGNKEAGNSSCSILNPFGKRDDGISSDIKSYPELASVVVLRSLLKSSWLRLPSSSSTRLLLDSEVTGPLYPFGRNALTSSALMSKPRLLALFLFLFRKLLTLFVSLSPPYVLLGLDLGLYGGLVVGGVS